MTGASAGRRQRRFILDRSVERFNEVLLGGSPLRVLRFTSAAQAALDKLWNVRTFARGGTNIDFDSRVDADTDSGRRTGESDELIDAVIDRLVGAGMLHPVAERRTIDSPIALVTPAHAVYGADRFVNGAVVVDDGSDPPIEGAGIRLASNRGPAAARNAGLGQVNTKLVAFVDCDVTVDRDWLNDLIAHFDDPKVALVAPRVRAAGPAADSLMSYEAAQSPLDLGPDPALITPGGRVSYVPATAIVCRVDAIRAIGGFDESLRYGEDVDLVWRLIEAGYRCRYEPSTVVAHPPRSTWRGWWRQRIDYGSSAAPLAARHGDAVAPARLNRWSLIVWIAALGGAKSRAAAVAIAAGSAAVFARRATPLPARRAIRLAVVGTWRAGDQLAQAVRRAWWPLLLAAAPVSPRARRALIASVLVARSPIRLADDLAYSLGVWKGCATCRSLRAVAPKIS